MARKNRLEDYIGCLFKYKYEDNLFALVSDIDRIPYQVYNVAKREYDKEFREMILYTKIGGKDNGRELKDEIHEFLVRYREVR